MPKISFLCVNFNNSEFTLKFCDSLRVQRGQGINFDFQCYIVDNSTSVPDALITENFSKNYSWINYIKAPTNLGYFGAFNFAFERIDVANNDYVVLCNNDLAIDENFCEIIFNKNYKSNIFAVCPDVLTKDGIHQNPHIETKIGWLRRFQFDIYFMNYYVARFMSWILGIVRPKKALRTMPLSACEVHMGIGACYVLTPTFLKRFKKLNYPHFLYGEEAYFSEQIHSVGGILWFDPDLLVHHAESASLSKVPKRISYEYSRSGYPSYRKLL